MNEFDLPLDLDSCPQLSPQGAGERGEGGEMRGLPVQDQLDYHTI